MFSRVLLLVTLGLLSQAFALEGKSPLATYGKEEMSKESLTRAKHLQVIGELGAASVILEGILDKHPKTESGLKAVLLLGEIYLKQNLPKDALKAVDKLLKKNRQFTDEEIKSLDRLILQIKKALKEERKQPKVILPESQSGWLDLSPPSIFKVKKAPTEFPVSPRTIGLILPLSGPYKVYGDRALLAVQLALGMPVEKFKGLPVMIQKNKQIRLVVGDSKASSLEAENLVVAMLANYQAIAILGDVLTETASAVAKKAQAYQVVNISLSRQEDLTKTGLWVFRDALTTKKQTRALAKKMIEEKGFKKFAILYPEHPYGIQMKESFERDVKALGGEVVVSVPHKPNETTFTDYTKKLGKVEPESNEIYQNCLKANADLNISDPGSKCKNLLVPLVEFEVLFVPDFTKTVSYIVPSLIAQDFLVSQRKEAVEAYQKRAPDAKPIQLLGPNSWDGRVLAGRVGRELEGALYIDGVDWESQSPFFSRFVKTFKMKEKSEPSLVEINAFNMAAVLRYIMTISDKEKQPKTRAELALKLKQLSNFPGLLGLLSFDEMRETKTPVKWLTFKNGKVQLMP